MLLRKAELCRVLEDLGFQVQKMDTIGCSQSPYHVVREREGLEEIPKQYKLSLEIIYDEVVSPMAKEGSA